MLKSFFTLLFLVFLGCIGAQTSAHVHNHTLRCQHTTMPVQFLLYLVVETRLSSTSPDNPPTITLVYVPGAVIILYK